MLSLEEVLPVSSFDGAVLLLFGLGGFRSIKVMIVHRSIQN